MFEAQYLMTDNSSGNHFFGPWVSRAADNITYMVAIEQISGATLTVELWEKNLEDSGNGAQHTDATTGALSATGETSEDVAGVEELVRYRYTIKANEPSTLGWVLFRMLPPVWGDAVEV